MRKGKGKHTVQPRKRLKRFAMSVAALFVVTSVAAACGSVGGEGRDGGGGNGSQDGSGGGADKEVTIGYVNWADAVAVTYLWKHVLQDEGYTVNLEQLDAAPVFQGLDKGDLDLYLDAWLPVLHKSYWDRYGDDLEKLGAWYEGISALTVPAYVEDVNSIEDLKDKADEFGGEVIGIDAAAGIMTVANKTIEEYGLADSGWAPEAAVSSESAMLAELRKRYEAEEPVVVTLWRPHYIYDELELKDLKDPEGSMGPGDSMTSIARGGFSEDHPEVAKWLKDFEMSEQDLLEIENILREEEYVDDPEAGVESWIEDNQEWVDSLAK